MKKNYEKYQLLFTVIFIFLLVVIFLIGVTFKKSFKTYKLLTGVVVSDNRLQLMVNTEDVKLLRANKYVYIKGKKVKKEIMEIERKVLFQEGEDVHRITMKIEMDKPLKLNEAITMSLYEETKKLMEFLKSCLEEGK